MAEKLGDVLQALRNKGEDLVSLDVVTFTGEVTLEKILTDEGGKKRLKLDDLFTQLADAGGAAKLRLVALTHRGLDRDVTTIVGEDLTEAERNLLALHKEMYAAAEEARANLVRLVSELVP